MARNKLFDHLKRGMLALAAFLLFVSCSAFSQNDDLTKDVPEIGPQWNNGWTHGAVFYQIFVRSFEDSNGDGIGDLNGLISKLDYLNDGNPTTKQDLEVDALWLMPVFESPSYHGYDTTDYLKIEQDYGTNDDFDRLLQEAHKRGLRIIVDFVMNHTSSEHSWFLESASSRNSDKRNWYVWSDVPLPWTQPWSQNPVWHEKNGAYYYGIFWSGMPDLNFRTKAVRKEIKTIAAYWLKKGVDGFRLDATRHLVETGPGAGQSDTRETHNFLKQFSLKVRRVKPEACLVGENWTDTPVIATYFGSTEKVAAGSELPMNFNFPLASAILESIKNGNASAIVSKLQEIKTVYPPGINDAAFLTNHDQVRLATQLDRDPASLRTAASILLTLPGAPFLYYAEEVGIQNGKTEGDESKRTPMPWDATQSGGFTTGNPWFPFSPGKKEANVADQTGDPKSLLSHYRNLIRARKSSPALQHGQLELISSSSPQVLLFSCNAANQRVLVAHNLGNSFLTSGPHDIPAIAITPIFTDGSAAVFGASGKWTITLPPHATGIWNIH